MHDKPASPVNFRLFAGMVLIATACLSLAPFPILGPAIGWPASLDAPAAKQLAAIGRSPGAVASGYSVYLAYSLLFLPAMLLAAQALIGALNRTVLQLVVAFAALSVLARSVGILRWLTVMPELSRMHSAAGSSERAGIEQIFTAFNAYGGGIGELLGVSLFAALALVTLTAGAWRARTVPLWITLIGLFASLALGALLLPAMGVAVDVPIALAVTALSTWMWALGGWLVVTRNAPRSAA